MPLSDLECRKASKKDRPYKLADGEGMYLLVTPDGSRYWRFDYRFLGKRRTLALGVYPDVTLGDARDKRTDARRVLAAGADPSKVKQIAKREAVEAGNNSFEAVARTWHDQQKSGWDPEHAARVLSKLERDVFPAFGKDPIGEIEPTTVLTALKKVEARGAIDVTKRTRQYVSRVFRFAIASGLPVRDPAADIRDALKKAPKVKHRAKLEEADLPRFLDDLDAYDGEEETQLAIRLTLLTLVRTNEIQFGQWSEFTDLEIKEPAWRIPAERMKMDRDHIVPLARQTIPILRRLKKLSNGSKYVLPAPTKTGVMSENTMLYAVYRMGYHSRLTIHGLRGTASTILNERDFNEDWVEMQLSHLQKNKVRAAYNAAKWLPQRRRMLQWWADFIENRCTETEKPEM